MHEHSPENLAAMRRALLRWYDRERRDLPWRRTGDPYRIWLSEVMLQQTRVDTAIPFYERFLERFPDLDALAAAELEEVLPLWSGLGYYRRIRHFHAAVREVRTRYAGEVPQAEGEFGALPGVGPYIGAAVRSIAFGAAAVVLDGNVERVGARLLALEGEVRRAAVRRELIAFLERFLSRARPGDFNQALMELGAVRCTPRQPGCAGCPLESRCAARAQGIAEQLPLLPPRKKMVAESWLVLAATNRGAAWLEPRGAGGGMEGLWDYPTWIGPTAEELGAGRLEPGAAPHPVWESLALEGRLAARPWCTLTHAIMHRRIRAVVLRSELVGERPHWPGPGRWLAISSLGDHPLTGFARKVSARLGAG